MIDDDDSDQIFHPIRQTTRDPKAERLLATPEAKKLAKDHPRWGPKRILRELAT